MGANQKHFIFYVLLLTFVAFLLRVYRLDFFSLRGDEAFTVIFVQRTWEGLWKGISTVEPNPPLMYLLLRAWVALAGAGEFATRFFSAYFGVLCVPLLYRLAREMLPRLSKPGRVANHHAVDWSATFGKTKRDDSRGEGGWVALFAATLIAINPYQIWHAQDVRNYTLWPALSLAALIFFWRWYKSEIGNGQLSMVNLLFYVLFTAASLYTHYYDAFILVAENIFLFAFALIVRRWKTLGRWIGAQVTLVLVYAPWVLFGTNRITTYGEASAQQGVSLLDQFSRTLSAFTVSETAPDAFRSLVWLPLALVLAAILIYLARKNSSRAAFLFLWIIVPTLALYAISLGRPLFNERYLNGIAPAYYFGFAAGLGAIYPPRAAWHPIIFSLAIIFLSLVPAYALANYWYAPTFAKAPDWRGLSQFINANLRDGDIIVQNFNEMSVQYYRRGSTPVITVPRDYWWRPEDVQTLERLNKDYRRIWFIPAQPDWWDPEQDTQKFLSRYDDRELETGISVFRLQLFSTPREFESGMARVDARVGAVTLTGYRVQKSGNAVRVVLYWRGAKIENDLHVFVHLADPSGRVIAQSDSVPVEGTYPTDAWKPGELIVDPYEIKTDATGAFQIVAGMYDPNTNMRAPALDSDGMRLNDDRVILTFITLP